MTFNGCYRRGGRQGTPHIWCAGTFNGEERCNCKFSLVYLSISVSMYPDVSQSLTEKCRVPILFCVPTTAGDVRHP